MDYRLPGLSQTVCRETFAFTYGVSVNLLKTASERLKKSTTGEIVAESQRKWNDSHYHGYDLLDTAGIIRENLGPLGLGGK
jgi:hypothetical protein